MPQAKKLLECLPKHKLVFDPKNHMMVHPVYIMSDIEKIPVTHRKPEQLRDKFAFNFVRFARGSFDLVTRYNEK